MVDFPRSIDGNIVVVADIHGCHTQLCDLLEYLTKEGLLRDRGLVCLGDFVDVGPHSAQVIDLLLDFARDHNAAFCCGNHDLNLAKALNLVPSPHHLFYRGRIPTRNVATLASYDADDADSLLLKMPDSHKEFLASLPWCVEHPDYLFVHAGLDPAESYEHQIQQMSVRDMWLFKPKWLHDNRLAFVRHDGTEKTIISGHVILAQPLVTDRRILLDTGAGHCGPLTAILLPERQVIQQFCRVEAQPNCTSQGMAPSPRREVMPDDTEPIRRQRLAEINAQPGSREALEAQYGQVWDTEQLGNDFEVIGFMAPLVVVRRKSDGVKGSLEFQHNPRYYFSFAPHKG